MTNFVNGIKKKMHEFQENDASLVSKKTTIVSAKAENTQLAHRLVTIRRGNFARFLYLWSESFRSMFERAIHFNE